MFLEHLQNNFVRAVALFGGIAALVFFSSCALAQTTASYGPNDRLGALNNLSPEIVMRAAGLIKTGKVYSLATATKPQGATGGIRHYHTIFRPAAIAGTNKLTSLEDMVILSPSLGTSMDGLGHVGRDGIHYNGVRSEDVYRFPDANSFSGARIFSIDTLPPIVTRGVLLDVARFRQGSAVSRSPVIKRAEVEEIARAQAIAIRRGDVVLLHTAAPEADSTRPTAEPIGIGKEAALYLANLGVVAVGGDPGPDLGSYSDAEGEIAPVHQILLVDYGIYILEGVQTQQLAADRAYEFLFIVAAPRLAGTVQATIHPVAIR